MKNMEDVMFLWSIRGPIKKKTSGYKDGNSPPGSEVSTVEVEVTTVTRNQRVEYICLEQHRRRTLGVI